MPTTLTFDIESKTACPPLICGSGDYVVIPLKPASKAKSHDGSGYLVAPITNVARAVGLAWRYTVVVPDTQLADAVTLSQSDVWPRIGCISLADACLFAKVATNAVDKENWDTVSLAVPVSTGTTVNQYLMRRATEFALNAIEIGMEAPQGPVTIQLQATTNGGSVYTNLGQPVTITPPAKSARRTFATPLTVPANAALRALITTSTGIYTAGQTVDLHRFTTKL
jgi:hypothetical protein